jgi:hypothetical protein
MSSEAQQLRPCISYVSLFSHLQVHFQLTVSSAKNASFATVLVGPDAERFLVHESLLIHYSKFFRAALTGHFKEAKEKTVTLEYTKSNVFEFFVHWLYYQRFPDSTKGDNSELVEAWTSGAHAELGFHKKYMIDLYIPGDRYEVPKLRNDAMSHTFHGFCRPRTGLPSENDIKYAFDQLLLTTPLCQYFVHLRANHDYPKLHNGHEWDIHASDEWPHAYLLGYARYTSIMVFLLRGGDTCEEILSLRLSDYHEHTSDEERSVCEDCQEKVA